MWEVAYKLDVDAAMPLMVTLPTKARSRSHCVKSGRLGLSARLVSR